MTAPQLRRIIGQNVRNRRIELEMTQAALAEAAGITQPNVASIERGSTSPMIETLAALAEALHCPPDLLLREDSFVSAAA